jgi:hypothetical protein
MKASDLFIKALENEGVEYIFGVPGEENSFPVIPQRFVADVRKAMPSDGIVTHPFWMDAVCW